MTTETKPPLASERAHFYNRDGTTAYEQPCTSKEGTRPTHIGDARKLGLVPSVTTILYQLAQPGLQKWKDIQLVTAALTLPRNEGEVLDDFAVRVVEDSKAQAAEARDKGKELHAAIEQFIRCEDFAEQWRTHIDKVSAALHQLGIPLRSGNPERSFASELGYGGKIDYSHDSGIICDFKTKDRLGPKLKCYDEHVMQLSAYGHGIFVPPFRALNVFVGIEDCEVRVFEHSWPDLKEAFEQFKLLLTFYLRKNKLGAFAK